MALPPQRITVKRRRDEDPIEALYLQQKKHKPSAIWTLASNKNDDSTTAAFVITSPSPKSTQLPSNSRTVPNPTTALASNDHILHPRDTSSNRDESVSSGKQPTAIAVNRPLRPGHSVPRNASEPRRFRLSKSPFQVLSPSLISKKTIKPPSKTRAHELAVFIEAEDSTRKKPIRRRDKSGEAATVQSRDGKRHHTEESTTSRKRPNATAEERKWRDENWNRPRDLTTSTGQCVQSSFKVDRASNKWDYECPDLAANLQKIAFEETGVKAELHQEHNSRQPLKTKPKPPKPRQSALDRSANKENEDATMTDIMPTEDITDYVFDTYIRSLTHSQDTMDSGDPFTKSLQSMDQSSLGIIVIEDGEEEELWEAFGEDVDSDSDWNSEEEDENAEDYYGNDYPEDEVDTDDELGRGAYNYRHYASDDEEFGDEEPNWSDDGKEALPP